MALLQAAEAGWAAAGVPGVLCALDISQAALDSLALWPKPANFKCFVRVHLQRTLCRSRIWHMAARRDGCLPLPRLQKVLVRVEDLLPARGTIDARAAV